MMTTLQLLNAVKKRVEEAATNPPSPFDNELLNEITNAILEEEEFLKEFKDL